MNIEITSLRTMKISNKKTLFSNMGLLFLKCLYIKIVYR